MSPQRRIVFLAPAHLTDPARPSGGNSYDQHLAERLRYDGWGVDLRAVGPEDVRPVLDGLADGTVALVDGILVVPAAEALTAHVARLQVVPLMHMSMALPPPGHGRTGAAAAERSVLTSAAAVLTTSQWLRDEIVTRHRIDPTRVAVVSPGVHPAPISEPSPAGDRLLCVAPVARHKGHDVLVDALAQLSDLDWTCTCVGSLERDAPFAAEIRAAATRTGIGDRVAFTGVCPPADVAAAYAASDLLVLPTRSESYGMVLTEALAHGIPVVVSDVGGVREAVSEGPADAATLPGALLPPGDPAALAECLRTWLTDHATRSGWRERAQRRRRQLADWDVTARRAARVLEQMLAAPDA